MPIQLSKLEIESAVRKLWEFFASKKTDAWKDYYADVALIFGTGSKRAEPARLAVLRRQREYLASAATMKVEVGTIEVELLGQNAAVATYLMNLDAEQIAKTAASGQKVSEEHLDGARVTHVFQRQDDGRMKIVHEHISMPQA